MPKVTKDRIAQMAELACFYVTPTGRWLRIDYCDMDEGMLYAHDEDSGDEFEVVFADITLESADEGFHELVKMEA